MTQIVGVEVSDERLAAVEAAKRTGRELESVGSKGQELVDKDELEVAVLEFSNDGASQTSPLPEYLELLKERFDDPEFVLEVNAAKAAEHEEYSADLIRAKREEDAKLLEEQRKSDDPEYIANQVLERQRKQTEEYEASQAAFAVQREKNVRGIEEVVREYNPFDATAPTAIEEYARGRKPTDISETQATEGHMNKDRIIFGETSYLDGTKEDNSLRDKAKEDIRHTAASDRKTTKAAADAETSSSDDTPNPNEGKGDDNPTVNVNEADTTDAESSESTTSSARRRK